MLIWILWVPLVSTAQIEDASADGSGGNDLAGLVDSLAMTNQIHGPYVGFSGEPSEQYLRFEELTEKADCRQLRFLSNHENAVVRGYVFWALARKHYPKLDSLLIAHARDEEIIYEIQGSVINQIPLIDFMQWVVDPDILDAESKKLDPRVFQKVTDLRFAEE